MDFSESPTDPPGGGGWALGCVRVWGGGRGGWTLDFSECPTDPPEGGGWTLDFSASPTDPLGGGGWTLDSQKERIQVEGGGGYKVTLVSRLRRWLAGGRRRRRSTPPPAARPVDTAKTTKKSGPRRTRKIPRRTNFAGAPYGAPILYSSAFQEKDKRKTKKRTTAMVPRTTKPQRHKDDASDEDADYDKTNTRVWSRPIAA